jgi:integrase
MDARQDGGVPAAAGDGAGPRLLDQVRRACRARQYSGRTAQAYAGWVRRYVLHHGRRHPLELDGAAVAAFLDHLANDAGVSTATQRQAAAALAFLHRDVLCLPVDVPQGVLRPVKPRRLPVVLGRGEVAAVLAELNGPIRLVASLLYGSGLRLMEGLQLRLQGRRPRPARGADPRRQGRP